MCCYTLLIFASHPTKSDRFDTPQVLPEDNSFNWGAIMLRLLPWEQTQRKDLVMSVLRALANNPILAAEAPKWQPKVR